MTSPKITYSCAKCHLAIKGDTYSIPCAVCNGWFHRKCSGLSLENIKVIFHEQKTIGFNWKCLSCVPPSTPPINISTSSSNVNSSPAILSSSNTSSNLNTKPASDASYLNKSQSQERINNTTQLNEGSSHSNLTFSSNDMNLDVVLKLQSQIENLVTQNKLLNMIITEKDEKFRLCEENKTLLTNSLSYLQSENEMLKDKLSMISVNQSYEVPLAASAAVSSNKSIGKDMSSKNSRVENRSNKQQVNNSTSASSSAGSSKTISVVKSKSKILIGSGSNISSLKIVDPLKWIFVSRLHKDVNDNDLISFIRETFNYESPVVVRIKPAISTADRDYASFKIGVPVDTFNVMLSPSSWPAGMLIKEFQTSSKARFLVPRSTLTTNQI